MVKAELQLRNIIRKLKKTDPKKRYEALNELHQLKQKADLQVQIEVLVDCIKAATVKYPEPVDRWDNPSYYLIDFVCDFSMVQITEAIMKYFDRLNRDAKERAIEFLLSTEDHEIFYFLESKLVQLIEAQEIHRSISLLRAYPVLARNIVDQTFEQIYTESYKFIYYTLIFSINESGVEQGYESERILPLLLEDYQAVVQEYLPYDSDYSTKFVYTAWRESYFLIHNRLRLFINLMDYYFSPKVQEELQRALNFNDPMIKTEAIMACLAKNIPYDPAVLVDAAHNRESAEMLYWKLHEQKCEHLYPLKEGIQPHLAKSRFFNALMSSPDKEGNIRYPEEMEIIAHLDAENIHKRLVRYYLIRFQVDTIDYIGWAGGYTLERNEPLGTLWDESYTDFVEFESMSVEEHKQAFLKGRSQIQTVMDQHVFYESSPELGTGAWFAIAFIIPFAIRFSYYLFDYPLLNIGIVIGLVAAFSLNQVRRNRKRKVLIKGDQLIVKRGKKVDHIELQDIEKIEHNRKKVFVYNKNHELACTFPLNWIQYELFQRHIKQNVAHYKEQPFIQP